MPVKRLFKIFAPVPTRWAVPEGQRVYAIGDIHGRRDLLDELLDKIRKDDSSRGGDVATTLVFLGDLVDRGPDSRGVVQKVLELRQEGRAEVEILLGNHEEVFLRSASGDARALRHFVRMGGRETILSYGISEQEYDRLDYEQLAELLTARVPREHIEFISSFKDWHEIGDYLFVHAGIRPGAALEDQLPSDLRWIRGEFLDHREGFGKLVVHGHTITEKADIRSNRIGIDTGAFATGCLTALGLQGEERWFLST